MATSGSLAPPCGPLPRGEIYRRFYARLATNGIGAKVLSGSGLGTTVHSRYDGRRHDLRMQE